MKYRLVGGPMHDALIDVDEHVNAVDFDTHGGEWFYHRTRPTDTDWRGAYDPEWFIKNLPEPVPPAHVFEWHERGWLSPEVRMIRGAVTEASARF